MSDERLRELERRNNNPNDLERLAIEQERAGQYRTAAQTARKGRVVGGYSDDLMRLSYQTGCIALRDDNQTLDIHFADERIESIDTRAFDENRIRDFAYCCKGVYVLKDSGLLLAFGTADGRGDPSISVRSPRAGHTRLVPLHDLNTMGVVIERPASADVRTIREEDIGCNNTSLNVFALLPKYLISADPCGPADAHPRIDGLQPARIGTFRYLLLEDKTASVLRPNESDRRAENHDRYQKTFRFDTHAEPITAAPVPAVTKYGHPLPPDSRLVVPHASCENPDNLANLWTAHGKRVLAEVPIFMIDKVLKSWDGGP